MKKTIYYILGLMLLLQTAVSCSESFLNETVYSKYAAETLTDSLGFQASLVGLYTQTSYWQSYTDNQGWLCVWQVGTDVAYSTPNQQGIEIPYYNYNLLISTDGAASYTWKWAYSLINNANIIISSIQSSSVTGLSASGKLRVEAEAKFFRAYAYNTLVTCFGAVPLVTEPISTVKTDFTRTSVNEVNAQLVSDLTFAAANLPTTAKAKAAYGNSARANSAMPQQLLAEVYLRMGKNAEAETVCKNIISTSGLSLVTSRYGINKSVAGDCFSDMFIFGNQRYSQGNTEAIWVLEQENPTNVSGGSTGSPQHRRVWKSAYYNITGLSICDSLGGRGIGRMRLNNWVLYNLYGANDMRNSRFNIRRDYWYNNTAYPALYGKKVPYAGADTVYKLCPHTRKWDQYDPNDAFGYGMWKDFILMRLGETYLLQAEAQYRQGGSHIADAVTTINTLRARSNAPAITSSQMSLDFILDERARELIGEENRRMTLLRFSAISGTNVLAKRALRLNQDAQCPKPIAGLDSTSLNKLLMPIPQTEIDLNKGATLEQNPGY